jgi:hypothetical protein
MMQNPQSSLAASAADTRAAKTETETATIKAKRIVGDAGMSSDKSEGPGSVKIPCFEFYYVPYAGPFVAHPNFAVGGSDSRCV